MTTQTPTTPENTALVANAPGTIARQDFAGSELAVMGDVSSQRAGAEARALVEARFVMALRRPRDLDDVRVRVMREVERPGFAEMAWYRKPVGTGVEGLSVRFFEAAARCMGNIMVTPTTTYDDATKRVVRVEVIDLETNYSPSLDVTIEKTVERSTLNDGRVALSVRKNSQGKLTYTVPATEDELLGKANALISKARRTLLQQIVPGDITDQAKTRILEIRRGAAAKDPEGARRKVIDAFAGLNVMPSDLKRWLGHDIAQASPSELTDLRDLYSTIQSGETTWADALAEKVGAEEQSAAAGEKKPGLAGVTERLQQKAATEAAKAAPATTPEPPRDCSHPSVPPARLAGGKTLACPDCGEELTDPAIRERAEEGREPGSDDGDPDPVEAVKAVAGAAAAQPARPKGAQRRLSE